MHICIFNPEHDLCLAKGRANYVPPRSAVSFARRDAALMQSLYPDAECFSAYDDKLRAVAKKATKVTAWGWNSVVKSELLKRGVSEQLLPSDASIATIRGLQHRSSILPLQEDAWPVANEDEVFVLLEKEKDIVLKAPWSGAGRGLRWLHSGMTDIDRDWLKKIVAQQGMAIAEKTRTVVADVALEYIVDDHQLRFYGYSLFRTGSGVYKENFSLTDGEIVDKVQQFVAPDALLFEKKKTEIEHWLLVNVATHYDGPIGIDLMVCDDQRIYVAEMNLRHTMGMVAHALNNKKE